MRFLFFRSISIIKSLEGWYQSPLFLLSLPPSVSIFSTLMFNVFKFVSKLFHTLASFAVQTFWIQIRIDKTSGPDQDSVGLTIVFGFFCFVFFLFFCCCFFFQGFLRMISFLLFFVCLFQLMRYMPVNTFQSCQDLFYVVCSTGSTQDYLSRHN